MNRGINSTIWVETTVWLKQNSDYTLTETNFCFDQKYQWNIEIFSKFDGTFHKQKPCHFGNCTHKEYQRIEWPDVDDKEMFIRNYSTRLSKTDDPLRNFLKKSLKIFWQFLFKLSDWNLSFDRINHSPLIFL